MFYGVEQSTDLRCRRTVIKKFTSEKSLLKWMGHSGGFTYEDPESAKNWHHTHRYGYHLHGRINKKDSIFDDRGTSTYPCSENDNIAHYLHRHGVEL